MGFVLSYSALIKHGPEKQKWRENSKGQTPQGLMDRVTGDKREFKLHSACIKHGLVEDSSLIPTSLPATYTIPSEFTPVMNALKAKDPELASMEAFNLQSVESCSPLYKLYAGLGMFVIIPILILMFYYCSSV